MSIAPVSLKRIPPLENGDHLTRDEFERRYAAISGDTRAELINGRVFMPANLPTDAFAATARKRIPLLENGDHLTRDEFERRYDAMPAVKAELIQGVVYMASPVRTDVHAEPHANLVTWLGLYAFDHPGVHVADNGTVRLDAGSEPQPDAFLRYEGGQSRISDTGYTEGAPELAIEISASTASFDLHEKKNMYLAAGVCEYIVWRVFDDELDWFILRNGEYELLEPDESGIIESEVFPGLRMHVRELVAGNYATALREPYGLRKT